MVVVIVKEVDGNVDIYIYIYIEREREREREREIVIKTLEITHACFNIFISYVKKWWEMVKVGLATGFGGGASGSLVVTTENIFFLRSET